MSSYILNCLLIISLNTAYAKKPNVFEQKLYDYTIYEVTAFDRRERDILYSLHLRVNDLTFINGVSNEAGVPMNLLVNNCCTGAFETIMQNNDIDFIKVHNEYLIERTTEVDSGPMFNTKIDPKIRDFHCYDNIINWVANKVKKHPIIKQIKIGETFEKRDIFVLKISTSKKKQSVFLMGGEEAKDWSSVAILLNFVDYLLDNHLVLDILRHYDFYVLPLFNPDGYMYSIKENRLWRKNTRMLIPKKLCTENESAFGVIVDRNWDFNPLTIRNHECEPIYVGPKPMSEQETIAVADFLNKIAHKMMAFINIRGTDNIVTIPYGNNKEYSNNYYVLMDMLSAVHDSVRKDHNTTFDYGLAYKYLYNFSSNSADWVKKHLNTPIVYTIYMKKEPFLLPNPADIQPLADQLSTMIQEILILANTFYGPLYNNQISNSTCGYIITSNIILVCYAITMLSKK